MFKIDCLSTNESYQSFKHNVQAKISFAVTGLVTLLRLLLIQKTHEISKKKILVITSTEQNALKYQNDLKKAYGVEAELLPFQNISMYESVTANVYDYADQLRILLAKPDIVITPVKTLLEKFPDENFISENSIKLKSGMRLISKSLRRNLLILDTKEQQWFLI